MQASLDSTDCRTKAEMIHEICNIMTWKRHQNELVYLHFVKKIGDRLSATSEQDEWVGKIRIMVNKLDNLEQNQTTMNQVMVTKMDKMMSAIQDLQQK